MFPTSFAYALLTLIPFAAAVDKTVDPELSSKLKLATTNLDRQSLLKDQDWVFSFDKQEHYSFQPGSVVNANAATFPALTGTHMTLATLNLGPCAMLPPHMHPRATNLVVAVSGNTTTYMVAENGAEVVTTTLTPMKMTIFPQGSLHSMQNNGCENAQLISALDSEDSGTMNFVNGVYSLPPHMIKAAFGNNAEIDIEAMGKKVPAVGSGSTYGSEECMKRCGMTPETN